MVTGRGDQRQTLEQMRSPLCGKPMIAGVLKIQ
jgi:hypothetical protein